MLRRRPTSPDFLSKTNAIRRANGQLPLTPLKGSISGGKGRPTTGMKSGGTSPKTTDRGRLRRITEQIANGGQPLSKGQKR